jgi:hypothetical protein
VRRAAGRSVAGVTAVLGPAVLCAAVLAGCRAHGAVSQQPADGVLTPVSPSASTSATTSAAPVNGAAAVVSTATGGASAPSDAGLDSDLNAVDGQLSGLDSALAQATQSPSDGG